MTDHLTTAPGERRRVCRWLAAVGAWPVLPAWAQGAPKLRAAEEIPVPGGVVTVLGAQILRGDITRVTLRLRVTADVKQGLNLGGIALRLLAAGVPRATENAPGAYIDADSAKDVSVSFAIADQTDDLVLQIRSGDSIERRRLSGGP